MKSIPLLSGIVLWLAGAGLPATLADTTPFLAPPGCVWGQLAFTNYVSGRAFAVVACPDGFVVAGEVREASDSLYSSAAALVLDVDGAILHTNVFPGLSFPGFAHLGASVRAVAVALDADGQPEGFLFTGYQMQLFKGVVGEPRAEWVDPALWVVKTDLALQLQWQSVIARGVVNWGPGMARWGNGIVATTGGCIVVGQDAGEDELVPYDHSGGSAPDGYGFLAQLDRAGAVLLFKQPPDPGWEWLSSRPASIAPAPEAGWVVAGNAGGARLSSSLERVWFSDPPLRYFDARMMGAHGYVALSRRPPQEGESLWRDAVLARWDSTGALLATNVFGWGSTRDEGKAILYTPEALTIAGRTDSKGYGATDAWIIRTGLDGTKIWDLPLGGPGSDVAYGVTAASGGQLVMAGQADVDGTPTMWVARVRSDLHTPVPEFTYSPASPVFRGHVVTFDASASSNPGAGIANFRWDFGDGTRDTGQVAQHVFQSAGTFDVRLTVTSTDGPMEFTTQAIEVTGLVIQWERRFGRQHGHWANSLVAAPDGGFLIAGETHESAVDNDHLWLIKTDRRGHVVWEKFYDDQPNGTESGFAAIPAPGGGYVVVGRSRFYDGIWSDNAFMAKIDEDGELAWPLRTYGEGGTDETALSVAAAPAGGYFVSGQAPINGLARPWIIRTDAEGNVLWSRHYDAERSNSPDWVAATSEGGCLFIASGNGINHLILKTDALGEPLWTNSVSQYDRLRWIGERQPPASGYALVGESGEDISLSFLNPNGSWAGSQHWTGMTNLQENDVGNYATFTPAGDMLIVGSASFRRTPSSPPRYEVAVIKTDPDGQAKFLEFHPGTPDLDETGLSAAPLGGDQIVILARRETSTNRVWLFKLAPNRTPVARIQLSPGVVPIGVPIECDGRGSADSDGTVEGFEWTFDDGDAATGSVASHTFTYAGIHTLSLTAVDDDEGESSATAAVVVSGVRILNPQNITDPTTSVTENAGADPIRYPHPGAPPNLNWRTAWGFHVQAQASSATTRRFQATFPNPLPADFSVYAVPGGKLVAHKVIDPYTIEVSLWVSHGAVDLGFVLAPLVPPPYIMDTDLVSGARLAIQFTTTAARHYRVLRTRETSEVDWQPVLHARTAGDPLVLDQLPGTGATETVYVEADGASHTFFRIAEDP